MSRKIILLLIILLGFSIAALGSNSNVKESRATASGIGITLEALRGPEITELYISYSDTALSSTEKVKVNAYGIDGTKKYTEVYHDVAIQNGVSTIPLAFLNQHETVEVEVTLGSGSDRMEMLASTAVKLRPEIAIQSVAAPETVLSSMPFNADVTVAELNKDIGADFTVIIKEGDNILASGKASIATGGSTTVSIPLLITQAGVHDLSAVVVDSSPAVYSTLDNEQSFSVEVLKRPDLTIQSLDAPASALSRNSFNVDVTVAELNGDTGANFTIAIKEGDNILASGGAGVVAGGVATVSIPLHIAQVGLHNLSAVIQDSNPAEDNIENNRHDFSVEIQRPLLKPDLTIQSIASPATALPKSYFDVDVSVAELNKDTGASFSVVIKEGSTVLASGNASVAPGGNVTVSIPLLIAEVGLHNLSAVIQDSNPAEDNIENNHQDFSIEIMTPPLNEADYTMMYYSQEDDYHNSKNLNTAADGVHIEVSDYTEKRMVEKFSYKLTLSRELIFPIDSLHIQVVNDSGIVEEHEYSNLRNETSYYPDTESTFTITSAGGVTEIRFERNGRYQETLSSGYNYYSASDNTSWNTGFVEQKGVLMNTRAKAGVYVEIIDEGTGYGGMAEMNLTTPVYSSLTWNSGGVTGYRNVTTYYPKQEGRTTNQNG